MARGMAVADVDNASVASKTTAGTKNKSKAKAKAKAAA
jgi:hypothetical protein